MIYETVQRYDQFKKEIEAFSNKAIDTLRLTTNDEEVSELNRYLYKWLDSNKDRNLLVLSADKDEILDEILRIFDGRVGQSITEEEYSRIKTEGKERYEKRIPPGYRDSKKQQGEENDNNVYGDLIIWKQIIKYSKDNDTGIVYVTHDQKEDWWNIVKGKTIGPRIELRREFTQETQHDFHMYSMNSFIATYNLINEKPIAQSVVDEVSGFDKTNKERHSKTQKNSDVSLIERITRTEETISKIENRIMRRKQIVDSIDEKYLKQGKRIPENIRQQYENTITKINELEGILGNKTQELNTLKTTASFHPEREL